MCTEQSDRFSDREAQTTEETSGCFEGIPGVEIQALTTAEAIKFLEFSPDALLIIDANGSIAMVNNQAARLFGYTQAELRGQLLEILLPERLREAHAVHRRGYMSTPRVRPMGVGLDLLGRRKNGSEFPVDISLRPVHIERRLHVVAAIRDITTQRLLEQERTFQATLLDLAHDAILVRDQLGRIRSWSRGAEDLYGWNEQEALGRVSHSLLQTQFPDTRAAVEKALEREGRWEGVLLQTCRDRRPVTVESRQILLRDEHGEPTAILEMDRNSSKRLYLEQAYTPAQVQVLRERTFLQQVLDTLPSGIAVVHGQDARLLLANQETARVWGAVWPIGQPMQAFLKMHHILLNDVQGRSLAPEHWAALRALRSGETVRQQQEVIRQPSGASLPILVNAVPLASAYWQSLGADRSSPSSSPDQQEEPLALVIYQDVRLLKEAEAFKEEFIGITAHELRQPLAVLKGSVGTLLVQTARGHGAQLADWQQEILRELDLATDRLIDLTDDLLDVSRLQSGRLSLHRVLTDLASLTRRVVERFQQAATQHQVTFSTTEVNMPALIDPRRIEQVLTNLLANALKYSPQGGPVSVVLEKNVARLMAEIRVKDAGMGIPARQQAHIFGRFMRADNAQAAGISGTGLGLYLCRALVEQHGGQIWFESTEGVGSTFFLTLPLEPTATSGPL